MNLDNYYDYHPRVIPERPIAITAFPGARAPLVGAAMSAFTGLPLHELDHLVEHEAGASISCIMLEKGEQHLRKLEKAVLERVLGAKPPGIIVLGESTLLARKNRRLVAKQAKLVYLELGVFELYARLRKEIISAPGKYYYLFPVAPETPQALRPLLKDREPAYHEAEIIFNMSQKHPTKTAQELIEIIGL
jgi:shikimate kinase